MKSNYKNIQSESSSFNAPKKQETQRSEYDDFIIKLLGKIFLTKKVFFGIDVLKIVLIVTPTLKIVAIGASPKKQINNFPFVKNTKLDTGYLKNWAESNGYEITFSTPLPRLKNKLSNVFGEVMTDESNQNINEDSLPIGEIKKSSLPESIKEWIMKNPEKFKQNILEIKNVLKGKRGD
jgi:hypothetical protein